MKRILAASAAIYAIGFGSMSFPLEWPRALVLTLAAYGLGIINGAYLVRRA